MMKRLTIDDVVSMSEVTLETEIDREKDEIGKIAGQLDIAKTKELTDGTVPDREWVRRATSALKIKRRLLEKMQQRAKKLRRESGNTIPDKFMSAARTLLQEDTFNMILESATHMNEKEG